MAVDLQQLAKALEASLDPSQNRQAEITLLQEEKKPNFSLSLLHIVAADVYGNTARLASALYFKNYIKRRWTDEDGKHKLPQSEVKAIKAELIGLMISVPPNIQFQLGDAVSVIADSDFWERWDTLVDDLVSRLTLDNPRTNNGVLQVAHSIFKRWRPLYRSDALYTEINHVLTKFGTPFLSLFETTDRLISQHASERDALHQVFASLNLIIKLLYDLSVQELPPVFEDNLPAVTGLLHKYLIYENKLLETNDDADPGPLEHVKAGVFEVLQLWVQKYEEDFGSHVGQFIGSSWNLLTAVGPQSKNDLLVSKALHFLTAITGNATHAEAFNSEATLSQVVELVVLPNLTLRQSDLELFEDEPIEFIRRDLEGSDSDTRRRATTDFLRQLMAKFPIMVSNVVIRYVDHYLSEYARDTRANWKSKDTAVYLYSAIAAKSTITTSQGVTSTNDFADIVAFFQRNIASDLIADEGVEPILKVDAIKYLYTFRSQITPAQWQEVFPLLVKHLGSSEYVIYTYAAIALERVMALNNTAKQLVIARADVEKLSPQLLQHLFGLIERNAEPAKLQENEFLVRCIMRVLIVIREGVLPMIKEIVPHFVRIIQLSSQNPSNPRFNYYLFEALGALIRFAVPSQPENLETELYSPLAAILQNDVQEFVPYVFQLFAALLEAHPSRPLSTYYQSLIPPVLDPAPWASKGNVPALVRFLSAAVPRGVDGIVENKQLETLLGVFQQLVATKTNEIYGFELLECILGNFTPATLEKYYVPVLQVLLGRLQNSKTDTFALRFVRLYHFISANDDKGMGTDFFIAIAEQVQAGVFVALYLNIILPDTQKLLRPIDRKTAVISLAKTLTDSQSFAEKYKKGWGFTCDALLRLLENPPIPPAMEDLIVEQDPDDMSFGVGYTQLTTIKRPVRDPWPEITDVKQWVGDFMKAANSRHGGKMTSFGQERLSPEIARIFAAYLQ